MMTKQLIQMIDRLAADKHIAPTKILLGSAAYEKLRREEDDWIYSRYLQLNKKDNCVPKFIGIPIQVISEHNVSERDAVYLITGSEEDLCETRWRGKCLYGDFEAPSGFAAHYWNGWYTDHTGDGEHSDISDDALMSVLNGGGFNAVATTSKHIADD